MQGLGDLEVFQKRYLHFTTIEVEVEKRIGHGDEPHMRRSKAELQLAIRLLCNRRNVILPKDTTLESCSSRVGLKLINNYNRNGRHALVTIQGDDGNAEVY
ncbi:hypothetical protein K439DRAFT_1623300 [Ramaria rubella]|nr:hypothetical protein K439DRAFT_1623300 [Ramaria rubella]